MPSIRCPDCMGESFQAGLYEMGDLFNDKPVVVRNVPGAKCSQCGYLLLPATAAKSIGRMLALGYSATTVRAFVYDLAEVDFATAFHALPVDTRTPGTTELGALRGATPEVEPSVGTNR